MWAIATFTFRETLRRRLVAVTVVLSLVFLALFAVVCHVSGDGVAHHVSSYAARPGLGGLPGDTASLALAAAGPLLGMYLARSFSGMLAILMAAGAISGDLETGALQSVLVRPVSRAGVLLGKFCGFAMLLVPYTLLLQLAVAFVARAILGALLPDLSLALLLLPIEPLELLALTLLGSTFLPVMACGAGGVLLFGLSVVGGDLQQLAILAGITSLGRIGVITALLAPGDVLYREVAAHAVSGFTGGLVQQFLGPLAAVVPPSAPMLVYAVVYVPMLLSLAILLFSRRDA